MTIQKVLGWSNGVASICPRYDGNADLKIRTGLNEYSRNCTIIIDAEKVKGIIEILQEWLKDTEVKG